MTGIAAAKAPPFVLPGEHFTAGIAFLLLGTVGSVLVAPDLAAGAFPLPRVVGVTHLFTLGWITTSIMGALYQFLPVALGESVRSVRAGHVTFGLYVPGLLAFVIGLVLGYPTLLVAGATMFGIALLIFIVNLAVTLLKAARRDVTWWALAAADLFLLVTLVLGLTLAGNLRWHYLGATRFVALGTHLHVALGGWVLLVIVGVAHRLLPMFLLSYGAGSRFARAAVALLATGAGILAVGHHGPPLVRQWLPTLCLGAGLGAFLLQARLFYRRRHRPALDAGMRLAAAALVIFALGLGLALVAAALPQSSHLRIAYVTAIVMGITLFIAAHYYKIVPFLVWYHRFGPQAGKQPVPRVAELYSNRLATTAGTLLALGAVVLITAVAAASPVAARVGALILATGAVIEALQMTALARRWP